MNDLQRTIYDVARVLLWPVLVATIICLVWVLIEFGAMLYEVWLRFRYRDLDALQSRALRARKAFADGKPRTAYRYLQENTYSLVVARFIYDLIRNYQGERLEAKPLKLLQEYEFYSIKRLERTRMLTRLGPMLGLMGTLIPLAPALVGLAQGNIAKLSANLVTAFSVTVLGLLIGGLAFVVSLVRDRMYSQDISDMEYMLELLQGDDTRLPAGRRRRTDGVWDDQPLVEYEELKEDDIEVTQQLTPEEAAALVGEPVAALAAGDTEAADAAPAVQPAPVEPDSATTLAGAPGDASPDAGASTPDTAETPPAEAPDETRTSRQRRKAAAGDPALSFDDPRMNWRTDDDPFADLGPVDVRPRADDEPDPKR
jgi:biopolymer transport protein ExbB/TolQ